METEAFYKLVNKLLEEVRSQQKTLDRWLDGNEAMAMLRITSKTTLQKLRDEGAIRFSQPMPKHILYDRDSILSYLDKHAKNTF